jgi:hypothetical protein
MFAAAVTAAALAGPLPVPSVYVTRNYALTFTPPKAATYCPLPEDWVGSDHGTTLFLTPPERCGGAGYPSSGRDFSPNVPRIEVYYGYWFEGDMDPPPCPQTVGAAKLIGKSRPLCRADGQVSLSAIYKVDGPAQVILTLVTTPERLDADLATLRELAVTVRPCRAAYPMAGGKPLVTGTGRLCPAGKWF